MKAQITPGPWVAEDRKTSVSIVGNGYCVATIRYAYDPANGYAERKANAKAIAAVPKLIEALIDAQAMINEMGPRLGFNGGESGMFAKRAGEVREAARAALAEAGVE